MIDIHGAGHRYKEITGRATDAIAAYEAQMEQLIERLTEDLAGAESRIVDAEAELRAVGEAVDMRWESVREALFHERWLPVGARPEPDRDVGHGTDLREHKRELQRAFDALHAVSRRTGWFRRG